MPTYTGFGVAVYFYLPLPSLFKITFMLYIGIGTGIFLTRYAIWQGRRNNIHEPAQGIGNIGVDEIWVYLGSIELGITSLYLQDLSIGRFFTQQELVS